MESHDVLMFHPLQQYHLIINHPLIALDVLLQNDLNRVSLSIALSLPDDPVCARTERPAETIL